jgi:hypothetical protein
VGIISLRRVFLGCPVKSNAEFNANFLFIGKHFMLKSQAGFEPENNFKNIYKFGIAGGFTTKIKKPVSWHFLIGLCSIPQRYYNDIQLSGGYFSMSTGVYTNLFEQKNILIGLTGFITNYNIEFSYRNPPIVDFVSSVNLSFLYKLNKDLKEDTSKK